VSELAELAVLVVLFVLALVWAAVEAAVEAAVVRALSRMLANSADCRLPSPALPIVAASLAALCELRWISGRICIPGLLLPHYYKTRSK